jgi:hypothetical protein
MLAIWTSSLKKSYSFWIYLPTCQVWIIFLLQEASVLYFPSLNHWIIEESLYNWKMLAGPGPTGTVPAHRTNGHNTRSVSIRHHTPLPSHRLPPDRPQPRATPTCALPHRSYPICSGHRWSEEALFLSVPHNASACALLPGALHRPPPSMNLWVEQAPEQLPECRRCHPKDCMSYPVFIPKPSTHHIHDPGSIVPHIRPKVFTDNQLSWIKYNYYYINSVSKDYDDSQRNGTVEDSITPQKW